MYEFSTGALNQDVGVAKKLGSHRPTVAAMLAVTRAFSGAEPVMHLAKTQFRCIILMITIP